jgi:hypothetical protein
MVLSTAQPLIVTANTNQLFLEAQKFSLRFKRMDEFPRTKHDGKCMEEEELRVKHAFAISICRPKLFYEAIARISQLVSFRWQQSLNMKPSIVEVSIASN